MLASVITTLVSIVGIELFRRSLAHNGLPRWATGVTWSLFATAAALVGASWLAVERAEDAVYDPDRVRGAIELAQQLDKAELTGKLAIAALGVALAVLSAFALRRWRQQRAASS